MAVDTNAIRTALRSVVQTASGFPDSSHAAWENQPFEIPNDGLLWFRETLQPSFERLTAYKYLEARGIVRYDVFTPAGAGTKAAETLATAILDVFTPPVSITYSGVSVIVERAERMQAQTADGWYMIPLSVYWRHHTPNT